MLTTVNEHFQIVYWIKVAKILLWDFHLMICSSIASYTVTESIEVREFNQLVRFWEHDDFPFYPNLCVCLFACLFIVLLDCFFAVFLYCHFECFLFLIYSMLKWQNKIIINFAEGNPSSKTYLTFCQVYHDSNGRNPHWSSW